jgi:enamine deaminase RidA (YjgF/YER057c/UK114 family)
VEYERRLNDLGIVLEEPPKPRGSYVPLVRSGNLGFISGNLPLVAGRLIATGRVGDEVDLDAAREAAKACVINIFARLKAELGSLDHISRWVKLTGFVASTPDFTQQPAVVDAASDLVTEVFGMAGLHSRSAVGVASLPMSAPVEIEAIVQLY